MSNISKVGLPETAVANDIDVLPVQFRSEGVSYLGGFSKLAPLRFGIFTIFEKEGRFVLD